MRRLALARAWPGTPVVRARRGWRTVGLAARETLLRRPASIAIHGRRRLRTLAEKMVQRWGAEREADDARASLLDWLWTEVDLTGRAVTG